MALTAQKIRSWLRLARVGVHIGEGFALGAASGALFFPHQAYQQPVIKFWQQRLCRVLGLNVTIYGEADKRPALWVSNHISWLDIPVIGAQFSVNFLSKSEVAFWPVIRHLAKAAGTLYIKRGSGDANNVATQMAQHLQAGRSVLFFPEGTTTNGTTLKCFYHKLFYAACLTGIDVQPVVLCYKNKHGALHQTVPFIDDDEFSSHLLKMLQEKPIEVELWVLPRVSARGKDQRALAAEVQTMMHHALEKLHRGLVIT